MLPLGAQELLDQLEKAQELLDQLAKEKGDGAGAAAPAPPRLLRSSLGASAAYETAAAALTMPAPYASPNEIGAFSLTWQNPVGHGTPK